MKISKEVKVGFLAIISLVVFYLGLNYLKGIDFFRPNNTYYAIYDDIGGLSVSNPVLINGLTVGRVGDIRILQQRNNKILVTIEVDDDILLGDSTVAMLITHDLFGNKAINLEIGRIGSPKQDSDTLISRIDRGGITEVLTDKAMPVVENINISVNEVNKLLATLSENRHKMNNIFDSFEKASKNLEIMSEENRNNINRITTNLNLLTETLNHPESGLKPLMSNLNNFADSLSRVEIKKTVDQANIAMQNLSVLLDNLNRGHGTLGKLATDDSLYINLNQTTRDLDRLLNDFRENPKRYVHFSIF